MYILSNMQEAARSMLETYPPQTSYTFIQTRCKNAIYIADDRVCVFAIQLFPQKVNNSFKLLRGVYLEHPVLENRSRS
jgi:hypothetical protein